MRRRFDAFHLQHAPIAERNECRAKRLAEGGQGIIRCAAALLGKAPRLLALCTIF